MSNDCSHLGVIFGVAMAVILGFFVGRSSATWNTDQIRSFQVLVYEHLDGNCKVDLLGSRTVDYHQAQVLASSKLEFPDARLCPNFGTYLFSNSSIKVLSMDGSLP